ncbi:hypothetical protein Tco_1070847 [Tanacetum coccineum]|uniref:Uncharacterized protein n=1 Tax=Tanacetum coccineum TaxID=301880 RepID=A0ABQ5HPE0_9ASTR
MITDEMKLTEHYKMYDVVFGLDVPTTQPQSIESTQGMHSTTSIPSRDELEEKQNVQKVKEHLIAKEIKKLVEVTKNVENSEVDSSTHRQNDNQNDPSTRLEPKSNKESPEVEITAEVQLVDTIEEEEESAEDDYELRRREKGKNVEEIRHTPSPTTIRSPRIHSTLISSDTEKLQELTINDPLPLSSTPSSSSSKLSATNCLLSLFKPKTGRFKRYKSFFDELQGRYDIYITSQVNNAITNHIPSQVDSSIRSYMSNHILHVHPTQASQASTREQQYQLYLTRIDNHQLQQDNLPIWLALKFKFKRLHVSNTPCRTSVILPRDQDDPHDDAHHEGENSAKRQKTFEHGTYVFGESSSGQVNKSEPGNSRPEKIVLSLYKFPAVIFPDDDIEERTSRWVDKCVKKFNPYARYNVEHWKNPHANIFYIKRQKELGKPKEEIYSNSKIVQIIKTYGELGHEHKFITEIILRRENGSIVDDYIETGLLWSLSVFIRSTVIWERVHDFQLVLEGLKSYNNNVKHGYGTPSLSKEDVEYLHLFEEEIEERLKHRDQMRR